MQKEDKPIVVVSRCLGFSACRYNGQMISDKFIQKLEEHVNYITVCPEVEIGLGIPRDPIRLVSEKEEILLYQPTSGKEYTKEMEEYSLKLFTSLKEVDGFILKGRSPSCGIKDVKIYLGKEKTVGSIKGVGLFAAKVLEKYPYLPIEEEGRLTNFRIREHFLTKLYAMFRFRQVEKSRSMAEIIKFQADNKFLLMAYSQKEQKILGRIAANHEKLPFEKLVTEYKEHLSTAFARMPRVNTYINVWMHIFGYFSGNLSTKEKAFVLGSFEKYKEGRVPLSVPINILRSYAIQYEQSYLLEQSIWTPYPEELMDISDTGKIDLI